MHLDKIPYEDFKEYISTRLPLKDQDKLQEIVKSASNNRIKELCEKKIRKVIEKKGYAVKTFKFEYNYFNFEIEIPQWKKCWWAMESDKKGKLYSGIWCNREEKIENRYV